jgi:hypothetical protein
VNKSDLQNWLLQNPGFKRRFQRVVLDSVANQFPRLHRERIEGEGHDWGYLLTCASLLAQSHGDRSQDTALRIASFCLEQRDLDPTYKDGAAVILDSLANQPAIQLAQQRRLIKEGFADRLPFFLMQDWTRRSIENSITLAKSHTISVNHFQKVFWQKVHDQDWISLSAPTSAGKSYILGRWLADFLRNSPKSTIVYLVPTRALIQQVQEDTEHVLSEEGIENASITSLPMQAYIHEKIANLLVLTQERFNILLGEHGSNIRIDMLIVDEAHKIGDSYRGVLLQQAIETAVHRNPACKILFASPMTENPGILLQDAPHKVSKAEIVSNDITVNQNLLWVSQVSGNPRLWEVELILDTEPIRIGHLQLPSRPSPESKRLPFIAFALGSHAGGNILYANGAADAEKAAKQVYDLLGSAKEQSPDGEIQDLIELIQKTVHRQYFLAGVLRRGIAFHYGNMPLLIRKEIERLFRNNKLKYLVCTSTLIEGVNMPSQSIFVRGPTKGRGKPMNSSDFWNLAGRAGRWGKEFQGNVVCIDPRRSDVWKRGAPVDKTRFKIERTSDKVLSQTEELLTFIRDGTPRNEALRNPDLEYVFSYLMSSYILNGTITQAAWARRFPEDVIKKLNGLLADCFANLRIPTEIVLRNPGISPIAMDHLLDYFEKRTQREFKPPEGLLPVFPESNDALQTYTKILYRINNHLADVFGRGKRVQQLALLIVDWMRGYPLARIISNRVRYYGKNDLASLIRNSMKDVEEFARFQAPKFMACYVDILRLYLTRIDRQDLIARLFELNIFLEFGVSQRTQLSLMGLGLSRSSAIALSELIADDSLDEKDCLEWLRENDWMTEDMPALIKREIANLIGGVSTKG